MGSACRGGQDGHPHTTCYWKTSPMERVATPTMATLSPGSDSPIGAVTLTRTSSGPRCP